MKPTFSKNNFQNMCFIYTKHILFKHLSLPRKNNNTSQIFSLFRLRTAFNVSRFESNTIRTQVNAFIQTRSYVVQMSQVVIGKILLFMNAERFKWSFLYYRFIYNYIRNKRFSFGKFEHFFF